MNITCIANNIPDIITFEIRDPNGIPVNALFGVFSVPNVTREYAGTYICVIMNTMDNSTVDEISRVVIQCKFIIACRFVVVQEYLMTLIIALAIN